jgi:hypothetical protein
MPTILLIGENLPEQITQKLIRYHLLRAGKTEDAFALLQTVQTDIIILALKDWHALLWEVVAGLPEPPKLVLLQLPGDQLTGSYRLACWSSPFPVTALDTLLANPVNLNSYAQLILPVQGSYLCIPFNWLQLVRRQMQDHVLVFTKEGDYWVSLSFEALAVQLPAIRFTCISNQLIVARKGLRITKRGLYFRGGYLSLDKH